MSLAVAIVGAGRMGRAHANSLVSIPDVTITGVADVQPEAAMAMAQPLGARPCTDYRKC